MAQVGQWENTPYTHSYNLWHSPDCDTPDGTWAGWSKVHPTFLRKTHTSSHFSLSKRRLKHGNGRKETEGETAVPQLSLLANYYFYMTSDDFCPGVSRLGPRHMLTSVIDWCKSHSQTVLSTGGFVLSQQLGGMIGIR